MPLLAWREKMARVPNRGKASSTKEIDLGFLDGVQVYRKADLESLRAYLREHPEAVEPMRWLVGEWGAENTKVEWTGVKPDGWYEYDYLAPCAFLRLPQSYDYSKEANTVRGGYLTAFRARFPGSDRHMLVLP